ncbi:MAG: hypothetical protein V8S87_01610 [Oscillospiraceae bacterium]
MADYILSCCSTADLTKEHFEERDIHYVCFHYAIDGQEYMDDLGVSMSFEEFYKNGKGRGHAHLAGQHIRVRDLLHAVS